MFFNKYKKSECWKLYKITKSPLSITRFIKSLMWKTIIQRFEEAFYHVQCHLCQLIWLTICAMCRLHLNIRRTDKPRTIITQSPPVHNRFSELTFFAQSLPVILAIVSPLSCTVSTSYTRYCEPTFLHSLYQLYSLLWAHFLAQSLPVILAIVSPLSCTVSTSYTRYCEPTFLHSLYQLYSLLWAQFLAQSLPVILAIVSPLSCTVSPKDQTAVTANLLPPQCACACSLFPVEILNMKAFRLSEN